MQRRGIAGADENTRADDAANSKEHQVPWAQSALQLAGRGFTLNLGDTLAHHNAAEQALGCGTRHYFPLGGGCLRVTLAAQMPRAIQKSETVSAPAWDRAAGRRIHGRAGGEL